MSSGEAAENRPRNQKVPAPRHRRQHRRRKRLLLIVFVVVVFVVVVGLLGLSGYYYSTTPTNTTTESSAAISIVGNTCGSVGSCSARGNTWGNTYGGVPETVSELAVSSDGYALSSASWEENAHNINVYIQKARRRRTRGLLVVVRGRARTAWRWTPPISTRPPATGR
jgi:cytoskeletal protein RodZ